MVSLLSTQTIGDDVAQLTVRNLDEELIRQLKMRAAANNRSAEAEHRAILAQALRPRATDFWERAARLREQLAGRDLGDSTEIIRQGRNSQIDRS